MRVGKRLVFLLFMLGLGCSPVRVVNTEAATGFRLTNYSTYNFYRVDVGGDTIFQANQEALNILMSEIGNQLEQRGLSRSEQPDLMVNIGAVVEERMQTRETHIREAPVYIGQRRYQWQSEEVPVGRYRTGTVSLHLVDRQKNALVWQGAVEGVIPDNESKLQRRIKEGVEKLFERMPTAP